MYALHPSILHDRCVHRSCLATIDLVSQPDLQTVFLTCVEVVQFLDMAVVDCITDLRHEKTCFCHVRTTKAQISLRIRAV